MFFGIAVHDCTVRLSNVIMITLVDYIFSILYTIYL